MNDKDEKSVEMSRGKSIPHKLIIMVFIIILISFLFVVKYQNLTILYKIQNNLSQRAYHKIESIDEQRILILGGIDSEKNENIGLESAEIFNIDKLERENLLKMNSPHLYHSTFKLNNGNILVADINCLEIYNPKLNKFIKLKTKPKTRYRENGNYKFAMLGSDKLVILGGRTESKTLNMGRNLDDINQIEIIDIMKDKLVKEIPFKGNGFGCVNLSNGDLVIVGGRYFTNNKDFLLNDIFILDKEMNVSKFMTFPVAISNPFVFIDENILTIFGGEIFKDNFTEGEYTYITSKLSPNIYFINLTDKSISTQSLSLYGINVKDNQILNAIKYSKDKYIIELKNTVFNNYKLIDIKNHVSIPIFYNPFKINSLYRSDIISLQQKIIIFGGKLLYKEKTEYSMNDEKKSYAKEEYNVSADGHIVNQLLMLSVNER